MATRPAPLPESSTTAIAAGALGAAALVGGLLTLSVPAGIAALIGVCYAPLVMINLRMGLALGVPLPFLEGLPLFNAGGKAAGLLIALAWIGMGRTLAPRLWGVVGPPPAAGAPPPAHPAWVT